MTITTVVTGKNQLTIPAAIARALDIEAGTEMQWEVIEGRGVILRPVLSRAEQLKRLEGMFTDLFPPGSDPIGDLIRERELADEEMD
jgi:AbrB family looped-hinge helix DNA binding protein